MPPVRPNSFFRLSLTSLLGFALAGCSGSDDSTDSGIGDEIGEGDFSDDEADFGDGGSEPEQPNANNPPADPDPEPQ